MNRLSREKSPYLLQHAANPVDWYPWGEEALQRAAREDRPIFLSIGYATCHWCHVMAHESFEDEEVARLLNRGFVPIKVDREERPDIDQIYMTACQAMTRTGGWPLSLFLTPDRKPFFAGTYFPREGRQGLIGFRELLQRILALWEKDRSRLTEAGEQVVQAIQPGSGEGEGELALGPATLERAFQQLAESFDPVRGGFGQAPKFPVPHNLTFLARWHKRSGEPAARQMTEKTLTAMRRGGIFDQIGFGFHRYSVDERWLVPHFEKMLYDQAQLALAYLDACLAFREPRHGEVAREIFAYVLRDMTSPEGGFYSGEDADSEGREGLFYVWTPGQVREVLGDRTGELVCRFYGIRPEGNFEEGLSVPHLPEDLAAFGDREGIPAAELTALLAQAREKLFRAREERIHPLKDDKILTAWNGLMIAALARGSQVLGDPAYARAAARAAGFVRRKLGRGEDRLYRRYRDDEAAFNGYLDDYAFLVWGLVELYETTLEVEYLEQALAYQESMLHLFWDDAQGGFFYSGRENESLIVPSKDAFDQALPSGNSVTAMNLVRLGRMTGNTKWEELAERTARAFSKSLMTYPFVHTQFLAALDFMIGPSQEIVIAGDPAGEDTQRMLHAVHRTFLPNRVLLLNRGDDAGARLRALAPHLASLVPAASGPTAYVCERYTCERPIHNPAELEERLGAESAPAW